MSKKLKTYQRALNALMTRLTEADRLLRESNTRLNTAKNSLVQLENYREDYTKTGFSGRTQVNSTELINFHQFIFKIRDAESDQVDVIQQLEKQHEGLSEHWRKLKARESGLEALIKQEKMKLEKIEQRKEQAALDEFVISNLNRSKVFD